MAQVSGIEVNITGNSSGLDRALGKAESSLSRFAKGAAAGIAGALSAGVFVAAGKAALNYADNIGKVAQKVGMTTEELSGLNYAAKLSDLSIEQLQSSLGIMARKMGDSAESFQAFGVSLRNNDGTMRGTNEVLMDVADKFAMMPDGVQKSQWALELFGRSGLDLIPLLNGGAASIAEMTNEARMFGVVVSQEAAAGAEQFNDNITRLTQYAKGAVSNFTSGLTPALVNVSDALVSSAGSSDIFRKAGEIAGKVLEGIARIALVVRDNFDLLKRIMFSIGFGLFANNVLAAATSFVQFSKAVMAAASAKRLFSLVMGQGTLKLLIFAGAVALALGKTQEFREGLQYVHDSAVKYLPQIGALAEEEFKKFGIDFSSLERDFTKARDLVDKLTSGGDGNIPEIPGKDGEVSKEGNGPVVPGVSPSQEVDAFYMARLESIREGFKSEREILEAEYAADMELLRAHLTGKDELDAEFKELMRQRAEQHSADLHNIRLMQVKDDLTSVQDGFASLQAAAQAGGKKFLKVSKAMGAAQAIVSTIVAAVDAMKVGLTPADKFAAYALVFAKGMSAVAAIKGVSEGGGGGGGGVGGGGGRRGGGGGASAAPAAASPTTTFQFTMMNDPMGFGEKFARQFIDQLNSTQRNGGTIRGVIA
jgi:hypothetical protein